MRKYKETPSRVGPVWSRPNTLRRLSQKTFLQLWSAREGLVMHTFFWGCWGLFIVVRSCLLSLQSKPHKLAEEVIQTCWTSLSGLLDKPLLLVEQVFWNVMGKSGPSSRLGAHAKGCALPLSGMWMRTSWTRQQAHWACWALFHNLHNLPSSTI